MTFAMDVASRAGVNVKLNENHLLKLPDNLLSRILKRQPSIWENVIFWANSGQLKVNIPVKMMTELARKYKGVSYVSGKAKQEFPKEILSKD